VVNNGYLLCFRWLEPRAEPRKASRQIRPAVHNNRHRHLQIYPRLWPGRPNFSICWCKHSKTNSTSNHEEVVMNLRGQTIKISSVPNPRYSVKWRSPLMPMLGFAPLNLSLLFLRFHVRTLAKLTSLPNNYAELPVSGGITIVSCKLMAMLSLGKNFGMLSEHIIYLKG
jgi:hypothetical protein